MRAKFILIVTCCGLLAACGQGKAPAASAEAEIPKGWQYLDMPDKLDGTSGIMACVASDEDPTERDTRPVRLCLYSSRKFIQDFVELADKGDFACDSCEVRVRFDAQPAEMIGADRRSDGQFNSLVLSRGDEEDVKRVRARLVKTSRFGIEMPLAEGGLRVVSFTTAGLDIGRLVAGLQRAGGG